MDFDFSAELSLESPIYCGIEEEIMDAQVNDAIEYIEDNYNQPISSEIMEEVLEQFDITYFDLPAYLVRRLDTIDVY